MARCSKCSKFGIGILSGIVLGMLIAPEKGSTMRRKIKKNTTLCTDKINSLFKRGKDDLEDIKLALQDETHEVTSDVREKLLKLIDETQKSIEDSE